MTTTEAIMTTERTPPAGVTWHPYADLFPWIEGAAFDELKADIAQHGVREPIVFLDGAVLDGRNRYMAARELGITFPRIEYEGDDPLGFVISHNLTRRHLTESQRGMVAAKIATAKQGGMRDAERANLPLREDVTVADAARLLNVSERSVKAANAVRQTGAPELVAAVEAGKVSVSAAAVIAKQPVATQQRIVAEDNVKRAAAELRDAERRLKEAEALPKAKPLTDAERAEQRRIFGSEEDRAVFREVTRITELVAQFPDASKAAASIPPAFDHAVDVEAIREVARWFDAFANACQDKEAARVAAQ